MLTRAEACERLGIGREKLAELIKGGELEAIKTGDAPNSHYRIEERAVEDYLERRRREVVTARTGS